MRRWLGKIIRPATPERIIIVSGLPRCGTSMMMKMLEAGGIPPLTDKVRTADNDNPKGYYEFERVKQLTNGDTAWLPEARGKAVKIISALLRYLPDEYRYDIIFMRREMEEVLASQRKMLVNRGEDPNKVAEDELLELFTVHLEQVLAWLDSQPNVRVLYISYNNVLTDPTGEAERIDTFLETTLDIEKMVSTVDPRLYRNRAEGV